MTEPDQPWPRMAVGNVLIDLVDHDRVISLASGALSGSGPLAMCSVNLHYLHVHMDRPEATRMISPSPMREGDMRWITLLDGIPLVRKANRLTGRAWPKLAGSDLLGDVLRLAADHGARVGFLGGSAETHQRLRMVLRERIPTLNVIDCWAPTSSELTAPEMCARIASEIRGEEIDLLVLALSKPIQEDWIVDYGSACGAKLFLPFGAAIEFIAGQKKRAPGLVSTLGLEWLWRFMLEPRRLGKRYLIDCPPVWFRMRSSATIITTGQPIA